MEFQLAYQRELSRNKHLGKFEQIRDKSHTQSDETRQCCFLYTYVV